MLTIPLIIALVLFIIAVTLFIAYIGARVFQGAIPKHHSDRVVELSATVRFILFTIPTLVAILGFLGYASYNDIIEKVREEIRTTYSIDEAIRAKTKSDSLRLLAQENYALILNMKDSLDFIIDQQINAILPVGAIVAYYGKKENLSDNWAICDGQTYGSVKTPDLKDKFILGGGWGIEEFSSKSLDEQLVITTSKRGEIPETEEFFLQLRPDQAYGDVKLPKYRISPKNKRPLPPYHTLVYIMRIR